MNDTAPRHWCRRHWCRRQADRGVTLIEMMVVLVIVAVMAGLAMTSLTPGSSQRKLTGAAEVLVQRLALASDEAMVTGIALAFQTQARGYGFVRWQGDGGWQALGAGPLAPVFGLNDGMRIDVYGQDGTALSTGPYLIAPGGDGPGFRVELQIDGQRRLVLFDGLNARQINADAGAGDAI